MIYPQTSDTALLPPTTAIPGQATATIQVNTTQLENFLINPQGFNYIENPLRELGLCPCATVFYRDPCCNKCQINCLDCCFIDCGFSNKYNTFLNTTEGLKYFSYNVAKFNCSCCVGSLFNRFEHCQNFGISAYNQIGNGGLFFAQMDHNKNCICCDMCPYEMDVNIMPERRLAGVVKIRGCCERCCTCKCNCNCDCCCNCTCFNCKCDCQDYYYSCEILDSMRMPKYQIYLRRCCLCSECNTGKNCSMSFIITTNFNTSMPVGSIEGYPTSCCTEGYTYNVNFPADATAELKVTLLNAVYAIDSFYLFH